MSYISPQGEQSTSSEIAMVAGLYNLAPSATGEFIRKTSLTTFENVVVSGGTADHAALLHLAYATSGHTGFQPAGSYLTSVTAHDLLSTTHGDTTAGAVARGDLITGQGATPKWVKLTIGTVGKVLTSDGTDIGWTTPTVYETAGAVSTHAALTTGIHGLAITAGQTLTVTIGGTLGSAAYTASTAYKVAGATELVATGGTGLTTIADGSVLATNTADTLTAITWHAAGTKVLTNTSGTISWEVATGGGISQSLAIAYAIAL